MSTGPPHSTCVSTRPGRPRRALAQSRSASQGSTSGSGAVAHPSTSRGAVGLVQSVVTGTVTYARLHMFCIVTCAGAVCGPGSATKAERMPSRVRIDPETAGLARLGFARRREGSGPQGERALVSCDEVVHRQVEVKLLRRPVRPSGSHVVGGALKGQRDP